MKTFLLRNIEAVYPTKEELFHPSETYPEYLWGNQTIAQRPNDVYKMVRTLFYNMGLDQANYDTENWNPLGEIIHPGNTVLLKPNMVMSSHGLGDEYSLDSVITHPSIVRAVLDYVIIALDGKGSVIVGDAPVQMCDFDQLTQMVGYTDIIDFYRQKGIDISLEDFRLVRARSEGGILSKVSETEIDHDRFIAIDIADNSMFCEVDKKYKGFRVTNYDPMKMQEHHRPGHHAYLIPKSVLKANVVINLPKPKTHRKAGMTGALKNMIGINSHKAWLPHHTSGSVQEGGDEYLYSSWWKKMTTMLQEKIDVHSIYGKYHVAKIYRLLKLFFVIGTRLTRKDSFSEGSWYGNNTVWRTIIDINHILLYASKQGVLMNEKQRMVIHLADMLVAGEGEGPLLPTPRLAGILLAGENAAIMDAVIATVMGFDVRKIPSINGALKSQWMEAETNQLSEIKINSNNKDWDQKGLSQFTYGESLQFIPSKGWKDHIELERYAI